MSRARRLLELLEILRRHKYPVTGAALAAELGISPRSLYRDVATLQSQGARIDGAAGLGYLLKPGFTLPPLMFQEEELEALALGAEWVRERGDAKLAEAAGQALAKIAAVLPPQQRGDLDASTLLVPTFAAKSRTDAHVPALRKAIRGEKKVKLIYRDAEGRGSERVIWPFALAYFDSAQVAVAWCEMRQGFRHFRTDRMEGLTVVDSRYPKGRQALLEEWRTLEGIRD